MNDSRTCDKFLRMTYIDFLELCANFRLRAGRPFTRFADYKAGVFCAIALVTVPVEVTSFKLLCGFQPQESFLSEIAPVAERITTALDNIQVM